MMRNECKGTPWPQNYLKTHSFDDPHASSLKNPSEPPEADQSVSIPGHLLLWGRSGHLCAGFWGCAFRRHTSWCRRRGSCCWRTNKTHKIYINNYYRFLSCLSWSDVSLTLWNNPSSDPCKVLAPLSHVVVPLSPGGLDRPPPCCLCRCSL